LLDFLGDVGGLTEAFLFMGTFLVAWYSKNSMLSSIIGEIFMVKKEDKNKKKKVALKGKVTPSQGLKGNTTTITEITIDPIHSDKEESKVNHEEQEKKLKERLMEDSISLFNDDVDVIQETIQKRQKFRYTLFHMIKG